MNRIVKFLGAKYDSIVPEPTLTDKNPMDEAMIKDINKLLSQYVGDLEAVKLRDGLKTAMLISSRGNQYLQENKIDNSLFANSRARCDTVVYHALNITYLLSSLFYPYIPSASASILRQLNLPLRRLEQWRNEEVATWWNATDLVPGHCIGKPEYLFKMIEEKKAGFMRAKYGGTQAENAAVAAAAGGAKPAVVGAVDGKKSSSKRGGAASRAPVLLSEVPVGVAKTPEMEDLETGIKSQGELVRTLKTDKAEPAKVKEAVDKLMELKKKLTDLVQK